MNLPNCAYTNNQYLCVNYETGKKCDYLSLKIMFVHIPICMYEYLYEADSYASAMVEYILY